jgi:hypothetical protein
MVVMLGALVIAATRARAHGGGRDKMGCHHDRKNGGYHCLKGLLGGLFRGEGLPGVPDDVHRGIEAQVRKALRPDHAERFHRVP